MGFSKQEYWSGLPFPSPGDLSNPGIEAGSPALQTDALPSEPLGKPTSFRISPSSEYSGLISFRIDWFDLLAVQGIFRNCVATGLSAPVTNTSTPKQGLCPVYLYIP